MTLAQTLKTVLEKIAARPDEYCRDVFTELLKTPGLDSVPLVGEVLTICGQPVDGTNYEFRYLLDCLPVTVVNGKTRLLRHRVVCAKNYPMEIKCWLLTRTKTVA